MGALNAYTNTLQENPLGNTLQITDHQEYAHGAIIYLEIPTQIHAYTDKNYDLVAHKTNTNTMEKSRNANSKKNIKITQCLNHTTQSHIRKQETY